MKRIPLTRGMFALCDDADYDWLTQWKWNADAKRIQVYAYRRENGVNIAMHRQLMGILGEPIEVDHIDGDGLNNQRSNLRLATRSQNAANRKIDVRSTSGFKSVSWDSRKRKWIVRLQGRIEGKRWSKRFGSFRNPVDAAKVADNALRARFGEFARTNEKLALL